MVNTNTESEGFGSNNFSAQFIRIVSHYKKIGNFMHSCVKHETCFITSDQTNLNLSCANRTLLMTDFLQTEKDAVKFKTLRWELRNLDTGLVTCVCLGSRNRRRFEVRVLE